MEELPAPWGPGDNAVSQPADRRAERRWRCRGDAGAQFLVCPSFACHRTLVWDASSRGVALLLDAPLEAGAVLALQVCCDAEGETFETRVADVTHVRRLTGGVWMAGCQLRHPLGPEEVSALAGGSEAPPSPLPGAAGRDGTPPAPLPGNAP